MDEKHLVWGSIVLFVVFWGEPDLLGSIISYLNLTSITGGR